MDKIDTLKALHEWAKEQQERMEEKWERYEGKLGAEYKGQWMAYTQMCDKLRDLLAEAKHKYYR